MDAINALFYILLKGQKGEAYNVANEATYVSIYELAQFVAKKFNPNIDVRIHCYYKKYSNTHHLSDL